MMKHVLFEVMVSSVLAFAAAAQDDISTYDTWGSWAPDGESLLGYSYSFGDSELIEIDIETGQWSRLTDNDANDWFPQYTPDGHQLVYVSDRGFEPFGGSEIFVRDIATGEERQLTHDGAVKMGVSISADGHHVIFPAPGEGGANDIWMINLDGSGLRNLSHTAHLREDGPSFTRDGSALIYSARAVGEGARDPASQVMRLDLESGQARTLLALGTRIDAVIEDIEGRVLFAHLNARENRNIARFDPETGEVEILTRHEASDHRPFPSPDGRLISFSTYRWGNSEIYLMDAQGRQMRNLTRTTVDAD